MVLISHRGNIHGPNPKKENRLSYLNAALDAKYQVEVDVWYEDGWWLGHDKPQYKVSFEWLTTTGWIWAHCKNIEAMRRMCEQQINHWPIVPHFFWHEHDTLTLTNRGVLWTYPNRPLTNFSICVLPEQATYTKRQLKSALGICSDYISKYKKL